MASAVLRNDVYRIAGPVSVGDVKTLVQRVVEQAQGAGAVLGLDFPIGVPNHYAKVAGIRNFVAALRRFGVGTWEHFYDLAERSEDISVRRPFYPARYNDVRQACLLAALNAASMTDLLRECERANSDRRAACSLFWTLGGNQVGRAAIIGWRDLLASALMNRTIDVGIWPFHGTLASLISSHDCVIVETYPADACVQIGLTAPGRGWSKQKQQDRCNRRNNIAEWARGLPLVFEADLVLTLNDGFDAALDGEDRFDAVIGLLGMLNVILGNRPEGAPKSARTRAVEGWILGMVPPTDPD